jgi:hypothetical protein
MAKPYARINLFILREAIVVLGALGIHLWYLFHTTFVDWPEMILYPWFLSKGLLYYRDVVLAYVPGSYYILYALYRILGFSVASERIIAYGFILLTDILVYIVAKRLLKSSLLGLLSVLFFVFWQPIFSGNTIWYETILAPVYLIGLLMVIRYTDRPSVRNAIYVGIVLAIASLIKQTAAWSIAIICLYVWMSAKDKITGFWRAVLVGCIPVGANLLAWGYFALLGAGKEYGYWSYGFLFALSHASSEYMMMPSRGEILLILPAFIPLIASLIVSRRNKIVWVLALWTGALILAGLPRWGIHRLQPALAFAAIGFGYCIHLVLQRSSKSVTALVIVLISVVTIGSWRSFRVFISVRDDMQPQFFTSTYKTLFHTVRMYDSKSIYVLGNYDYLYFDLNSRPAVLPYVPLFPWNGKVPGMQQQLINSLEKEKVQYVLYIPFHENKGYYDNYSPNELLLYLASKYEKITPLPVEGGWVYSRK